MTASDWITRRRYLEDELALAAATHQHVLDGPAPADPTEARARDDLLDHLRTRWSNTLACLKRHTDPAQGGDPNWQGPIKERARHAAGRFAGPAPAAPRRRPAETALRAAVERAERALFDDDGNYSVSRTHDAALELAHAARALLDELNTR